LKKNHYLLIKISVIKNGHRETLISSWY